MIWSLEMKWQKGKYDLVTLTLLQVPVAPVQLFPLYQKSSFPPPGGRGE